MDHSLHAASSPMFMPHGHCYLWTPGILWMEVVANAIIALAYYSIPVTLFYFIRNRRDLPYQHVFLLFGFFILACGTGHILDIVTIWHPVYWAKASMDFATAMVSIGTACALWPLLPRLLRAGTIEEVLQRRTIEQLEQTNEQLATSNAALQEQMDQMRRATAVMAERETRIQELRAEVARLKGEEPGTP